MSLSDWLDRIKLLLRGVKEGIEARSVGVLEEELKELEGAYALLLLGSFLGLPSPPSFVGLSLMPYLEREMIVALGRSRYLGDAAAFWFEIADI